MSSSVVNCRHPDPDGKPGVPAPRHRELPLPHPAGDQPVGGDLQHLHPGRLRSAGPLGGVPAQCQVGTPRGPEAHYGSVQTGEMCGLNFSLVTFLNKTLKNDG